MESIKKQRYKRITKRTLIQSQHLYHGDVFKDFAIVIISKSFLPDFHLTKYSNYLDRIYRVMLYVYD